MSYSLSGQISKDDPRQQLWEEQRHERGFDNTELWNLDITFASFLLPQLKLLLEYDFIKLDKILHTNIMFIIETFEIIQSEVNHTTEEYSQIEKGLQLFVDFNINFKILYVVCADFMLPRLTAFVEIAHIKENEDYYNEVLMIIKTFEIMKSSNTNPDYSPEEYTQIESGLHLFSKCYMGLWY